MKTFNVGIIILVSSLMVFGISCSRSNVKKLGSAVEYYNQAKEYYNQNKLKEAINSYKKAIDIDSNYAEAYYELGNLYQFLYVAYRDNFYDKMSISKRLANKSAYGKAVDAYKKAISINPHYAEAHYKLGMIYGGDGLRDKEIAEYQKAIAINPDYAEVHAGLTAAYCITEQYLLASKHCDRAIELGEEIHPLFLKVLKPYRKQKSIR